MVNRDYSRAYTEVLEILSHFSKEDYSKIPDEEIEYFKNNMDKTYEFSINPEEDLSKQNISKEANAIIVNLFIKYYATEEQKNKINEILSLNQEKEEQLKREKYNPDNIFNNRKMNYNNDIVENDKLLMVIKKENFFVRFFNYIKSLLFR